MQIAWIVSLILSFIALTFMFTLTYYTVDMGFLGKVYFTFTDISFGSTQYVLGADRELLDVSWVNLIGFIFVGLGMVCAIMKLAVKSCRKLKITSYIAFLLLIAASIIVITSSNYVVTSSGDSVNLITEPAVVTTFLITLASASMFLIAEVFNKK